MVLVIVRGSGSGTSGSGSGTVVAVVWERRPPNKDIFTTFNSNLVAFILGGRIRIRALNIFVTYNKT